MNNVRNILLGAVLTAGMINGGVHAAAQDLNDSNMPNIALVLTKQDKTRCDIIAEKTFELEATPFNTKINVKNATRLDYAALITAFALVVSPTQAIAPYWASLIIGYLTGTQAASFINIYLMALAYNLYQLNLGYLRACKKAEQDAINIVHQQNEILVQETVSQA